jgi:hypothetical protein
MYHLPEPYKIFHLHAPIRRSTPTSRTTNITTTLLPYGLSLPCSYYYLAAATPMYKETVFVLQSIGTPRHASPRLSRSPATARETSE